MSIYNIIPKEILPDICPKLKQLRLERELSFKELQEQLHISPRLLKRMEEGKCLVLVHFIKLLKFYGKKMRIVIED